MATDAAKRLVTSPSSSSDDDKEQSSGCSGCLKKWLVPSGATASMLATFVDFYGAGMIVPLLPFWTDQVGADVAWVGIILSVQGLGVCLGSIMLGVFSDHYGRKVTLLATLVGDVVFFFLSAVCVTPVQLLIVRLFSGFSTPISPSYAWMLSEVSAEERTAAIGRWTAYLLSGFSIGTMAGAFIGGSFGWFWALMSSAILVLVVLIPMFWTQEKQKYEALVVLEDDKVFSPPPLVPFGSVLRLGSSKTLLTEPLDTPSPILFPSTMRPKPTNHAIGLDYIAEDDRNGSNAKLSPTDKTPLIAEAGRVVMKSPEYIVLCIVQFFYGCVIMANNTLVSVILKDEFVFKEEQVGSFFTVMASCLFLFTVFAFKHVVQRVGEFRIMTLSSPILALVFGLGPFCVYWPPLRNQWSYMATALGFTIVFVFANPTLTVIASNMAQKFQPDRVGVIVGTLRACFNLGQAVGPAAGIELLESVDVYLAFLVWSGALMIGWMFTILIRLSRGLKGFAVQR